MRVVYVGLVVLLSACIGTVAGEALRIWGPDWLARGWLFSPFRPLCLCLPETDIVIATVRASATLRWNLLTAAGAIAGALWCFRRVR